MRCLSHSYHFSNSFLDMTVYLAVLISAIGAVLRGTPTDESEVQMLARSCVACSWPFSEDIRLPPIITVSSLSNLATNRRSFLVKRNEIVWLAVSCVFLVLPRFIASS